MFAPLVAVVLFVLNNLRCRGWVRLYPHLSTSTKPPCVFFKGLNILLHNSLFGLSIATCLPRRRQWHPTPVLLPGKSHGQRSLVGCSPWGRQESDTTERLHFHFSLSCIGEGNGNPLQCSCLENPRDGGAWWAAVYGVAKSWTQLKQLSSSKALLHIRITEFLLLPILQTVH